MAPERLPVHLHQGSWWVVDRSIKSVIPAGDLGDQPQVVSGSVFVIGGHSFDYFENCTQRIGWAGRRLGSTATPRWSVRKRHAWGEPTQAAPAPSGAILMGRWADWAWPTSMPAIPIGAIWLHAEAMCSNG